jgi:hypothetical protein
MHIDFTFLKTCSIECNWYSIFLVTHKEAQFISTFHTSDNTSSSSVHYCSWIQSNCIQDQIDMFCPPMCSNQLAHCEQVDVVMSAVCFGLMLQLKCPTYTALQCNVPGPPPPGIWLLPVHGLRMQLVLYAHVRTFTGSRVDEGPAGHCNRSSRLLIFLVWEVWLLNGSTPDCCPAVPGSNPASPQPTADCQSYGGLPPRMALGCGLTSVRGNRGVNCEINH